MGLVRPRSGAPASNTVQNAAKTAGMNASTPLTVSDDWNGIRLRGVFVVAVTPPDDHAVNRGIVILVNQLFSSERFYFFPDRIVHIIVPKPFLDQVAGAEAELLSVV